MHDKLHMPMLWLLLPLIVGIHLATILGGALSFGAVLLIICTILLFALRRVWLVYPIICAFGCIISSIGSASHNLVAQYGACFTIHTQEDNAARIISIKGDDGAWHKCNHRVIFRAPQDQEHTILIAHGSIFPFQAPLNDYQKNQKRKGFEGQVVIDSLLKAPKATTPPLSTRMNKWAVARLRRLELRDEAFALAAAVGLAHREDLADEVVTSYTRSGTSHLLALSGLHFGIVILIISALTYYLPLLRNGHIIADIITIVAIWLFAMMAGMGPSIMRAAWMFSLLRFLSLVSGRYDSLNALCMAAVLILCFDTQSLYDVGFQLSFVAVAAILLVGAPLTTKVNSANRFIDYIAHAIIIGTVASVAVMPLVSYYFGNIAMLGALTTLPLLPLIMVIILATLVWVLLPFEPLAPLFWWTLEVATTLQNYLVEWFASLNLGFFSYRMSFFWLLICYVIMLVVFILAHNLLSQKRDWKSIFSPTRR